MLEEYEVGQKLTAEDFVDSYYFPQGKWLYCVVENITDDTVTLHYYGNEIEDTHTWTRSEMAEMLGWDISADDNSFDGTTVSDDSMRFV